jgi:hypothetical protein
VLRFLVSGKDALPRYVHTSVRGRVYVVAAARGAWSILQYPHVYVCCSVSWSSQLSSCCSLLYDESVSCAVARMNDMTNRCFGNTVRIVVDGVLGCVFLVQMNLDWICVVAASKSGDGRLLTGYSGRIDSDARNLDHQRILNGCIVS